MRIKTTLALLVLASFSSIAQESTEAPKPATKLEAFQAKSGSVIIKGYTTVGRISGINGIISVDAREIKDAGAGSAKTSGITISVKEDGRLARENTSFIDADEVASLLQGIEYISKVTKEITHLENFEAEYRTKGDFSIVIFNTKTGELSIAVSSGRIGKTSAYIKVEALAELKQLINQAKLKLGS
ncbi:hypothetical protein [Shewanella baltica]|uniref:hypothetical protein n=1 Tax=Shewanella baltica TaxID=62322 RepID=UPI002167B8F6|nr:hypothetical protein [Shewanella baltica]MCS6116671.1 hypothetical protein [Shewanella baltica]UVW66428.1 hypothetical protein HHE93_23125 [Shewanella baltica]